MEKTYNGNDFYNGIDFYNGNDFYKKVIRVLWGKECGSNRMLDNVNEKQWRGCPNT